MTTSDAGSPTAPAEAPPAPRTVLVTGATGYIGGRLVPRLLRDGHTVRAAVTDPAKARNRWWRGDVDLVTMNVLDPPTVAAAVEGVDAVYYLIHGLGGVDFAEVDRRSATTMAEAAAAAGTERIVYLSGLVPDGPEADLSEHITSRLEVERILTASGIRTLTLRAAIVTGSGSTSFEIVRQISERLPVQTIPRWMDSRVQPIAVTDVVEALAGALAVDTGSRHYDVGGPERMPYSSLLDAYAEVAGLSRPQVIVPGLPTELVGSLAGVIADVPGTTVEALVESLHHDMVCHEVDWTYDLLPEEHELVGVRESFRRALAEPDLTVPPRERDPLGPLPGDPSWAGGQGGGLASAIAGARAVVTGLAVKLLPGG
ncbi:MAG TPA: NAD(P)H-binding protein [Ornithinibacter sp.]|nr:NAD(P)H-binding protein [Ornithinibacter sp.]